MIQFIINSTNYYCFCGHFLLQEYSPLAVKPRNAAKSWEKPFSARFQSVKGAKKITTRARHYLPPHPPFSPQLTTFFFVKLTIMRCKRLPGIIYVFSAVGAAKCWRPTPGNTLCWDEFILCISFTYDGV